MLALVGMNTGRKVQNIFLTLKKGIVLKNNIRELRISGVITTDPFSILAEQKRFYQELYESRNNYNTEGMQTIESLNNYSLLKSLFEQKNRSGHAKVQSLRKNAPRH